MIPHTCLHAVRATSIGKITWSEHAPVFLTYDLTGAQTSRHCYWRLDESLLQIPEVLEEVTKELTLYFQMNDLPYQIVTQEFYGKHISQFLEVFLLLSMGLVLNENKGNSLLNYLVN